MNNHVRKNSYRVSGLMLKGRVPLLSTRRNIPDSCVFMLCQTASIAPWKPQQDQEPHIMITGSSLHGCYVYSDASISYVKIKTLKNVVALKEALLKQSPWPSSTAKSYYLPYLLSLCWDSPGFPWYKDFLVIGCKCQGLWNAACLLVLGW